MQASSWLRICFAISFLVAFCLYPVQSVPAEEQTPGEENSFISYLGEKWTGDLDGIQKRRILRALVVYSKTHFFIDRGTPRGMAHDGLMAFEKDLNRRLKTNKKSYIQVVFIPVQHDELIPALLDGRGDIAVANLTITPERQTLVDFSDPSSTDVRELVVTAPGIVGIDTIDDLADQSVFVRPSSSYYEHIIELNLRFMEKGLKPIRIVSTPPQLEEEDILEMVNAGLISITVVDSHLADFWAQLFTDMTVHRDIAVSEGGRIAPAIRRNCPQLKAMVNACMQQLKKGTLQGNVLLNGYLKNTRWVKNAVSEQERQKFRQTVDLFKKYGDRYQFDYLLLAAQGYQESGLNQGVRSPVGAVGIMQIMPATGKELGVGDIYQVEPNIHGGAKYMRKIMEEYFHDASFDDLNRNLFAFASYNAGPNRIARLRKTAASKGYDPDVWFDNVERVVAEKVGQEPVRYVSNIFKYYVAYKLASQHRDEVSALKDAAKEGLPQEATAEEKAGFFKRIFGEIF